MSADGYHNSPSPGWFRLNAATVFLTFVIALPVSVGDELYAALLIFASLALVFTRLLDNPQRLVPQPLIYFAAIVLVYLALSAGGLFAVDDHRFSNSAIVPQAAGLLIVIVMIPAFAEASEAIFFPTPRLLRITFVTVVTVLSVALLRSDESIFVNGQLYGAQPPGLLMHFAFFVIVSMLFPNRFVQAGLMLLPMPLLGAATNVLIQMTLAAVCLTKGTRALVYIVAGALLIFVLVLAFPTSFVVEAISGDPNAIVRSRMWNGAILTILQEPLGIGFGNSYTDRTTMWDPYILSAYSEQISRSFEVANHSSLLDMTMRLSVGGLAIFSYMFWNSWRRAQGALARLHSSGIVCMVLIGAALNPMLESARASLFIAFAAGYLHAAARASAFVPRMLRHGTPNSAGSMTPAARRAHRAAQLTGA